MKLIKAYNMGSKSFQKFSGAIQEENAMWNETSRRMGPPYATFVVLIECGMLLMVPLGGMFFLKGSLAASAFLLFVYVGSMYTGIGDKLCECPGRHYQNERNIGRSCL